MHEVEHDLPGARLRLADSEPSSSGLGTKLVLILFFAPFLLGPCALGIAGLQRGLEGLVMLLFAVPFGGAALALMLWALWATSGSWSALDVDRGRGTLALERRGVLWWRTSRFAVPLERLRALRFEVGAERASGEPLPITVHVTWADEAGKEDRALVALKVRELDRRAEAMDLVFRMARAAGWPGYLVHRSDPRQLDIELVRKGRARRVPEVTEPVDYTAGCEVERFEEPELKVASFDPAVLRDGTYSTAVWKPGERVRLVVSFGSAELTAAIGGGAVLGAIAGGILYSELDLSPAVFVLTVPAVAGLTALLAWLNRNDRETDLDWTRRRARFRLREKVRDLALDEISALVLRGHKILRSSSSGGRNSTRSTTRYYRCTLEAVVPGHDPVVHKTQEAREDPERPYQEALPMTVELAQALGVPWRWEEYP